MARYLIKLMMLVLALGVLVGCGEKKSTPASDKLQVGLVFDIGGRGDKSFNDSAFAGLEKASKEFNLEMGKDIEYIEPSEAADRESALRQLASKGKNLVVAIGFIFSEDVNRVAKDFPNTKFACVDYVPPTDGVVPANVVGLKFNEEEGSFLVGVIAGLVTKTNKIGFVGGMKSPLIAKFEKGFKDGVLYSNPKCTVFSNYAGVKPEAFKDPSKGKELALSMYGKGADIIYHASGATGSGVFEAAREQKKLAIGVDSDQYNEAPGFVLTSMVKRVDVSVFETIKAVKSGTFTSGIKTFDLANSGVDYVYDDNNKALIPSTVKDKVEEVRQGIISGKISVKTK